MTSPKNFPVGTTDEEWQKSLDADAYRVLRKHGTERAGTHPFNHEKREGTYHCAGCGKELY
ncbi:MAG: peptide-methionine (R)-S-oxide reductase, partial [Rhizomicrobium sp.]